MLGPALALCLTSLDAQSRYADTDRDGLLDSWEREGFGPIDPKVQGCDPNRPDVFIVFRIRSTMTQEKIQPTIDRMKKFYASMPHKNADGSNGLNLIAIVPPPMPKETDTKGYIELYEQAMPKEWRGLAHGILVDDSPGGGGQCNRPDWCGTGYNWQTMLHEVGHQFGLPHDPLGARTGSPFHRSLMNYDYSYQLGGVGENIIFSDGMFAKLKMKETALNETVPFPLADLEFLSKRPYHFKLKELGSKQTAIDWNRNGVFGESKVRADVNDGYSVAMRGNVKLERTAGQAAMVGLGKALAVVYPDLPTAEAYKEFKGASLSPDKPGRIQVQLVKDAKAGKPIEILASGATGDPSAAAFGGSLWVAAPTATGFSVIEAKPKGEGLEVRAKLEVPGAGTVPTLAATPTGLFALLWNKDQTISIAPVGQPSSVSPVGLTSQHGIGATWNPKLKRLAIATTEKQNTFDGRIRMTHLKLERGKWSIDGDPLWVGGEKGDARTSGRPVLLFDPVLGAYTAYVKGQYADVAQPGVNYSCRQIADLTHTGGWRIKMMGNEWALSRSVCSAAPFQGDTAYIYRWAWGDDNHCMLLSLRASGIENEWLTDFDEVGFIFERGLSQSLTEVRNEQWRRRR